jgi:hypothetical protein
MNNIWRAAVASVTFFAMQIASPASPNYAQNWDNWADVSVNRLWGIIIHNLPKDGRLDSLKRAVIKIDHHDNPSSGCLIGSNIAFTTKTPSGYEITFCARQTRFLLHFMDAFTTIVFDSERRSKDVQAALDSSDFEKLDQLQREPIMFYQTYEDYIIKNITKELDHFLQGDNYISYQCGPDFFKMLMDKGEDFSHCTQQEEGARQLEFRNWYDSATGPGGRFASAVEDESGTRPSPEDLRQFWNSMHDDVNNITIYFVLLHEAAHIIDGDLERKDNVDSLDRSDARAEAAADNWALQYITANKITDLPMVPGMIAATVVLYIRYMYEEGPEPPRTIGDDTKRRMVSLSEYETALAALPSNSKEEADLKNRFLRLQQLLPAR